MQRLLDDAQILSCHHRSCGTLREVPPRNAAKRVEVCRPGLSNCSIFTARSLNILALEGKPAAFDRIRQAAATGDHGHTAARDAFQRREPKGFLPARRHHDDPMPVEKSDQFRFRLRAGKGDLRLEAELCAEIAQRRRLFSDRRQ